MDKIENLLKAAQRSDELSPNIGAGAFSTPPRSLTSSSSVYASPQVPPPPPLHRVQIVSNPFITSNSSNVIVMPSLNSPYAYAAKQLAFNAAMPSLLASSATVPTSAVLMTRPLPAWLPQPRYPVRNQVDQVGLAAALLAATATSASGEGHVHDTHAPMCVFPDVPSIPLRRNVQAYSVPEDFSVKQPIILQGSSSGTITFDGCKKPIAVRPLASFVSPARFQKKDGDEGKSTINYSDLIEQCATSGSCNIGSAELKPSKDEAPPAAPEKRVTVLTPDTELLKTAPLSHSTVLPLLFDEEDIPYLTEGNYIICTEVIEPFVVPNDYPPPNSTAKTSASKSNKKKKAHFRAGTVAFRCRFCHEQDKNANQSNVYPKDLWNVYRANLRFKRSHLYQCSHIPCNLKRRLKRLEILEKKARKNSPFRSKQRELLAKKYWVETMKRKGFIDDIKGISFKAPEQS